MSGDRIRNLGPACPVALSSFCLSPEAAHFHRETTVQEDCSLRCWIPCQGGKPACFIQQCPLSEAASYLFLAKNY